MEIGTVKIDSRLALAPMAGVTDAAFRQVCAELGAGLTYTELVSAKALCYQDKKSRQLLMPFPGEKPFAAQIFGSDIPCMAEAAQIAIEASGAELLDINMGCPVGKVVSSGDGEGGAAGGGGGEGVSRAGDGENAPGLGQGQRQRRGAGEAAGGGRRQRHRRSRPDPGADVRRHSRLDHHPGGEGGRLHPGHRQRGRVLPGGRGPHSPAAALAGEPVPERPPLGERCDAAVRQIELAAAYNCEKVAVLCARRHYAWYLKGVPHAAYYREKIVHMETLEDVRRVTDGIKRDLHD